MGKNGEIFAKFFHRKLNLQHFLSPHFFTKIQYLEIYTQKLNLNAH